MIETVYMWSGIGRPSHDCNVDRLYDNSQVKCVVVDNYKLKDYLEALQLIYGGSLKVVMLWDWADEMFDRVQDPRKDTNLDKELFLVGSNRSDLHEIWFKHHRVEQIKRKAESMRRCELEPQATFNPSRRMFI